MPVAPNQEQFAHLYPSLSDYMGLELTPELVAQLEEQEKALVQQQVGGGGGGGLVRNSGDRSGRRWVRKLSGQAADRQLIVLVWGIVWWK